MTTATKTTARPTSKASPRHAMELVLGGGGIKGLAHVGFLTAVEELNVKFHKVTGVSIGALVATLYVNGYSPSRIEAIFEEELSNIDPRRLARSMMVPPQLEKLVYKSEPFSLRAFMANLVDKYKLKPRARLRLVAFNAVTMKPVLFEGTNYNLADALTASCALPYLFQPVRQGKKTVARAVFDYWTRGENDGSAVLFDGGLYHPYPGEFCRRPAIIAKLGYTHVPAPTHLPRVDRLLHQLEYKARHYLNRKHPDPTGHLIIEVGGSEIATMTFNITAEARHKMIINAYKTSLRQLKKAIAEGQVPVRSKGETTEQEGQRKDKK